jgi:hypothetical protein
MYEWRFLDYVDGDENTIREWLNDKRRVPVKAKAKIQRILLQLAGTEFWTRPLASNLDSHPGIVEIRVRWMNTQYRILGYRGPRDRDFTLLFPAVEKGDQFVPLNAPKIAEDRLAAVNADWSKAIEHRFS